MYVQDEKVLALFERKRANFVEDYGLQERPALIIQCQMTPIVKLNLDKTEVTRALEVGAAELGLDGWWRGFTVQNATCHVFDGLSSAKAKDDIAFTTEIHEDGHFIAAVWTFPKLPDGSPYLGDFYALAFRDALFTAQETLSAAGAQGQVITGGAFENSNKVAFALNWGGRTVPPPKRKILVWPLEEVSTSELAKSWKTPATRLVRVYHQSLPAEMKA